MKRNYPLSFGAAVLALTAVFALTLMGCATTIQDTYKSIAAKKPVALQTLEKELAKADKEAAQEFMGYLLKSGGSSGAWDESNTIPALRLLISKGADVNYDYGTSNSTFTRTGVTPLYHALDRYSDNPKWSDSLRYEIAKFLLENGADPNIPYTYRSSALSTSSLPITYAVENEALQALLVEHGSPDFATAVKMGQAVAFFRPSTPAASSGSSDSGSAPNAGGSSAASAFKDGEICAVGS